LFIVLNLTPRLLDYMDDYETLNPGL